MNKQLLWKLALCVCSTVLWSGPVEKKKTVAKASKSEKAKSIPIKSIGYPETITADLFLTMSGNNVKTNPITILAESKPELMTKIAKHYEEPLKKFGFSVLSWVSPEEWDRNASHFISSTGLNLAMFRMQGKDVKYILTGHEADRVGQVQFIGSRDQGSFTGSLTGMYLALEIRDVRFDGPRATVVLTPNISIDADLNFQGGGSPLKNYLKPNFYNSELLRREIVSLLNENAPKKSSSTSQNSSDVDRVLVADLIDAYAKDCLYQFELMRDSWQSLCTDNNLSPRLQNGLDQALGLDGSYAERSQPKGMWGVLLTKASRNIREGGDPSESRALIEQQSRQYTKNAESMKDIKTTGTQSNALEAGMVTAKICYEPLLPKLKAILDSLK